jgi:hypothetical protein
MIRIKGIAGFLYYITRIFSVVYSVIAVYAIVVLVLAKSTGAAWVPVKVENGEFTVYWPFTERPFLLGDYSNAYLVPTLLTIGFYAVFFWLLGSVFDTFRQAKLFVPSSVARLKRFYLFNFLMPILIVVASILYMGSTNDYLMIALLHAILGVFTFFMAAIFRQGLLLQEEQDLTL